MLARLGLEASQSLNAIVGFAELLTVSTTLAPDSDEQAWATEVVAASHRLQATVDAALDLIEASDSSSANEPMEVDVAAVVHAAVEDWRPVARSSAIELISVCEPDVSIRVRPRWLRNVIDGVLGAAIIRSAPGAPIELSAESHDGGRYCEVEISVSGAEFVLPSRLGGRLDWDHVSASLLERLGLKLVGALRAVTALNGEFGVDGGDGGGRLWLRLRERPLTPSPPLSGVIEIRGGPGAPLVLVVEDDPEAASSVEEHLVAEGYRVVTAASAEAAITIVESAWPDAILLDIRLQGADGWEVLEHIQSDRTNAVAPVVIVSAIGDAARGRGMLLGAREVLQKPVSPRDLVGSLEELRLGLTESGDVWVLVADPNVDFADQVAAGLRARGFEVSVANDLAAAKEALSVSPDLVVVSAELDGGGSQELIESVRRDPVIADIPVVVLGDNAAGDDPPISPIDSRLPVGVQLVAPSEVIR